MTVKKSFLDIMRMNFVDRITVKAFLVALLRQNNPLPVDLQNQLNRITKILTLNISEINAVIPKYSPLFSEYKDTF